VDERSQQEPEPSNDGGVTGTDTPPSTWRDGSALGDSEEDAPESPTVLPSPAPESPGSCSREEEEVTSWTSEVGDGDIAPPPRLYEIPQEEVVEPSAVARGVAEETIQLNDMVSAEQAYAWLQCNVPVDLRKQVRPPGDAPGLHPMEADDPWGFYVNWRDLFDGMDFRWRQFLAAQDWVIVDEVIKFGAANLRATGRPIFVLQTLDGDTFYVKVDVKKGKPQGNYEFTARLCSVITGDDPYCSVNTGGASSYAPVEPWGEEVE